MRGGILRRLISEGVSPWLNGFHRGFLQARRLSALAAEEGVRGATAQPALLSAALSADNAYRPQLARLARDGTDVGAALRALQTQDARLACDDLGAVHEATGRRDGHVSMDLDPGLAHDAAATVAAATALMSAVARQNALVKIPATAEGLTAIRDCVGRGIGVHAVEIYTPRRYREVADAYCAGLEIARDAGRALHGIVSLASAPVHRIDTECDARLAELGTPAADALRGGTALALARLMYHDYDARLGSDRWRRLAAAGARPQRLLWTVDGPHTPDQAGYAARLVGWHTALALPLRSLVAADRWGTPCGDTLDGRRWEALRVLDEFERTGLRFEAVAGRLAAHGEKRLVRSWEALRGTVGTQLRLHGAR
ncbi:transaldolase family protein [Streptomyces sp. 142MFCol3.1]|uniref:transaldolase family protein n=1 Tax=Streptomyces sp. 142MFCol3.1 TaxID=1172179 RepID=UPI0003F536F7